MNVFKRVCGEWIWVETDTWDADQLGPILWGIGDQRLLRIVPFDNVWDADRIHIDVFIRGMNQRNEIQTDFLHQDFPINSGVNSMTRGGTRQ